MKKITSYITSIFCVFIISISLVYAYSTDIYDIDILDGFYKAENNDYWQKEGEDSSLSILIYTEKNKNNLDLSSYSEDDIDEEEYINALKRSLSDLGEDIQINTSSVKLVSVNNYPAIKMEVASSYKISDEANSDVYQLQYIFTSKNYVYHITVSSSAKENLSSSEVSSIINSFTIKDEQIKKQNDFTKYYITLGIIIVFGALVLICSKKITKNK